MLGYLIIFIAVTCAIIGIKRPGVMCGLIVMHFAMEQWGGTQTSYFFSNQMMFNLVVGVLAILVLVLHSLIKPNFLVDTVKISFTPAILLPTILFTHIAISSYYSINPALSVKIFFGFLPYIILTFYIACYLLQDPKESDNFLNTLCILGLLICVLIFTTSEFKGRGLITSGAYLRTNSNRVDDVTSPLVISTAICFSTIAWLTYFKKWGMWGNALKIGAAIVGFLIIFRTASRGQILTLAPATVLGIMIATPLRKNYISFVKLTGLMLLCIPLVYISYLSDEGIRDSFNKLSERALDINSSIQTRVELSQVLYDYWWSRDDFYTFMFGLGSSSSSDQRIVGTYVHNIYIEVLCELGVVGIVLLMSILGYTFYAFTKALLIFQDQSDEHDIIRRRLAGLFGCWVVCILLALKQNSMLGAISDLIFFSSALSLVSIRSIQLHSAGQMLKPAQHYQTAPPPPKLVPLLGTQNKV